MAADFLTDFVTSLGVTFENPITMLVNIILSTVIMGIILLIIVEIIGKQFSEEVNPIHAFLVALVINIINIPIIFGLISSFVSFIPFLPIILPLIIWIIVVKLFFRDMEMLHAVIVGVIGFVLSIFLIPYLVDMVGGFIPSFG
jgi:hypothetical protein